MKCLRYCKRLSYIYVEIQTQDVAITRKNLYLNEALLVTLVLRTILYSNDTNVNNVQLKGQQIRYTFIIQPSTCTP